MTKPWNKPVDARDRTEGDHEYRVQILRARRVVEVILLRADDLDGGERMAKAIATEDHDGYLVEPILHCVGCEREMPQPDPRGAKLPDGSPVYPDPDAFVEKKISCVRCGPNPVPGSKVAERLAAEGVE